MFPYGSECQLSVSLVRNEVVVLPLTQLGLRLGDWAARGVFRSCADKVRPGLGCSPEARALFPNLHRGLYKPVVALLCVLGVAEGAGGGGEQCGRPRGHLIHHRSGRQVVFSRELPAQRLAVAPGDWNLHGNERWGALVMSAVGPAGAMRTQVLAASWEGVSGSSV